MLELREKLAFLYPTYVLAIVSIGYVLGELGHYLIGVTSKAIATDLHYGKTCFCGYNGHVTSVTLHSNACEPS